jgi:hypothetical protein
VLTTTATTSADTFTAYTSPRADIAALVPGIANRVEG